MKLDYKEYVKDVERVVDYNFDGCAGIVETMKKWERNKEFIYKIFQEDLIIKSKPIILDTSDESTIAKLIQDFLDSISECFPIYAKFEAFELFIDEAIGKEGFTKNKVQKDWHYNSKDHYTAMMHKHFIIDIKKGMKFSKALKYFLGDNEAETLKRIQTNYSTFTQKFKSKRPGCVFLSIHPLDYLSISDNNHNWRSCHSLEEGDFRFGNLNYLADGVTMVGYYASEKSFESDLERFDGLNWNSKQWRILIHIKEKDGKLVVVYNKQYPYQSPQLLTEIDNLLMPYINAYYKNCNILKEMEELDDYFLKILPLTVDGPGTCHYSDLTPGNNTRVRVSNNIEDEKQLKHFIMIGEPVNCIKCGNYTAINELSGTCEDCEEYQRDDDEGECSICGEYFHYDDLTYVETDDVHVCERCYDEYYQTCAICDEIFKSEDTRFNHTLDEVQCDECFAKFTFKDTNLILIVDSVRGIDTDIPFEDFYKGCQTLKDKINDDFRESRYDGFTNDTLVATLETSIPRMTDKYLNTWVMRSSIYLKNYDIENLTKTLSCFGDLNDDLPNLTNIELIGFATMEIIEEVKRSLNIVCPDIKVTINPTYILPQEFLVKSV